MLKRAELVAVASALFKTKGYEATTLADIGERVGLDRATVYYYVGSKQELFQTSIEGILDENLRTAERLLLDESTATGDKLRLLIARLMTAYDANYPHMFVYIQEQMHRVANDPSPWAKDVQRKTARLEAIVRKLVEEGMREGKMRRDVDARVAVKGLFGMLNWTSRWYAPGGALSPDKVADTFCTIFFEGVTTAR